LDLSNNQLSGGIPEDFSISSSLAENNFVGERLEIDISNYDFFNSLFHIDLSNSNLFDKLPRWISNLSNLENLVLSNNHFEDLIGMKLCNLDGLRVLDLRKQFIRLYTITGNIPKWIGTLSALGVLVLKANHLDGRIPVELCKLHSLSIIDLSQNMLSGPIPSCLGNLTLGSRMALTIMREMSTIDLSYNNLTSQISLELGKLSEIHSLNFSHNNLTGVIPSSFSNFNQIESLDLSYDNLSGRIPVQLVGLNFLAVFSVAHNNLSGSTLERKGQFGTFDENSYEGNPLLYGPPLHNNCSKTDSPPTINYIREEGEGSLLDTYVFCVVLLLEIFAVLYINPYWRRAWFSFIKDCIIACHFSIVSNFLELYIFKTKGLAVLMEVPYVSEHQPSLFSQLKTLKLQCHGNSLNIPEYIPWGSCFSSENH
ncbi:Leucine-rich repeat - like 10, partial [Theobroma cacao]